MDLAEDAELAAFRAVAREWLVANAPAKGSPEDFTRDRDVAFIEGCRRWQATLCSGGWAGIAWPEAHGGRGLSALHDLAFRQLQAGFGVSTAAFDVAVGMVGPTLMVHGTDAQKRRHLGAVLEGQQIWCQMFSEPGAGSDLAGLSTRARATSSGWVVNGQKVWTSYARFADYAILLARSDPAAPKHRGITCYLLDMRTPGIEVRPIRQMNGASEFNEVFLTDVELSPGAVLGDVDGGWAVANTMLGTERGLAGDEWPGAEELIEMARRRELAGNPVARQGIAEVFTLEQVLHYLDLRVQSRLGTGRPLGPLASVVNLFFAAYLRRTGEVGASLTGPAMTAWPWSTDSTAECAAVGGRREKGDGDDLAARWRFHLLTAPSVRIASGTDEIQRNILGERALGLPREPRPASTLA